MLVQCPVQLRDAKCLFLQSLALEGEKIAWEEGSS